MRPTVARLGGGARFPYPKEVWSPAGGWWTRPSNWKTNTLAFGVGVGVITYQVWMWSAKNEQRHAEPTGWIPSMLWSKEFKDGKLGIRDESHLVKGDHGHGGGHH